MPQGGRLGIETTNRDISRERGTGPGNLGRAVRRAARARHRRRDSARSQGPDLRTILHDQTEGRRHGARPVDGLRIRPAKRRRDHSGQRARRGHDVLPVAPAHGRNDRGRQDPQNGAAANRTRQRHRADRGRRARLAASLRGGAGRKPVIARSKRPMDSRRSTCSRSTPSAS